MKKFLFLLLVLSLFSIKPAFSEDKIKIAVLDLEPKNTSKDTALSMSELLRSDLTATGKFDVVDKLTMDKAFKGHPMKKPGCSTPDCIMEAAKTLNVSKVITGNYGIAAGRYTLNVSIMSAETGKPEGSAVVDTIRESQIPNLSPQAVEKLTGFKPEKVAEDKTREIKKTFKSDTGPSKMAFEETQKIVRIDDNMLGLGANFLGGQLRYGFGGGLIAEGRMQFGADNTLYAGRFYYTLRQVSGGIPLIPYVGVEFGISVSPLLNSGFEAGGFAGGEVMVTKYLGVGFDAGYYYVSLASDLGNYADTGIIINIGVTFYMDLTPRVQIQ